MAQTINTNVASLNAQRNLNTSQMSLATSLQRLSSGLRINSAKDDAAGLAISERMGAQVRGLNQAVRNANDAISLSQTAEGSLSEIGNVLQRMREIAVQSANDTNTATDRAALQTEATQLSAEIDRIAGSAQFNGKNLLDGTFGTSTFQVGANAGQAISVGINSAKTTALGVGGAATAYGATASATTAFAYSGGAMTINGTTVAAAANDGVSYVAGSQSGATSALSVANAINAVGATTSVTATATTSVTSGAISATTALAAGDLYVNGVSIGAVGVASTNADRVNQLVQAINAKTGSTGVTAAVASGTTYKLTAADGRNIDITSDAGASVATTAGFAATGATGGVGGTAFTYYGTLTLTAGKAITVGGTVTGSGLTAATSALVGTAVDVTSQAGANAAITSLDTALSLVNTQRATLGAVQSRFQSVISNLQSSSENLSAAKSRITDADFAAETANLSRGQILQQAGVAMLAQANALPNNVLSLLKG
jgi:flagellin